MWCSCSKDENGSTVPKIDYQSHELLKNTRGQDSILLLRFNYSDSDGDLGFTDADTLFPFGFGQPYFYNLFAYFYGVEAGQRRSFLLSTGDTLNYHVRLQSLTPTGRYRSISGQIELRVDFLQPRLEGINPTTMQMEVFIIDRNQNRSNTITSPQIDLIW